MTKLGLLAVALVATALVVPAPAHADVTHVTLDGVRVALHEQTRQVVTVNHTHGYHARIGYWVERDGRWTRPYAVRDGRIGYGGLVAPKKRHQGTGTTPSGTVKLISAFGRHARDTSWDLPYRRIHKGDYWVEDNGSRYYNRYRNKAQGGFRWWLPASHENSSERRFCGECGAPLATTCAACGASNGPTEKFRGCGTALTAARLAQELAG